ncbi:MAG: hypothetical protein JWR22_2533 [Herminiimonas sp.]|nr:hypothetical protein [Herminiimonas sp.]
MKSRHVVIPLFAAIVLTAACTTNVKKPTADQNPPPSEAFSKFGRFELKPINTVEGCDKQHGADVALRAIQDRMTDRLGGVIATWNKKSAPAGSRKLIVEPICSDAKLVGTSARIWGGAFAGSSAIVLKVRYVDAATGKTIAEPVFYQRASAMGAAWTFGATDRDMLKRIVDLVTDYAVGNYMVATGGPTGL